MRKMYWLLIFTLLPATSLADVTIVTKDHVKLELQGGSSDETHFSTIYIKGSKKLISSASGFVTIFEDAEQQKLYTLFLNTKKMIVSNLILKKNNQISEPSYTITRLPSTKIINGFKCQAYQFTNTITKETGVAWTTTDFDASALGVFWDETRLFILYSNALAKEIPGFPIYVTTNMNVTQFSMKGVSTKEIQSISFDKIPDTIFPNLAEYSLEDTSKYKSQQTTPPKPSQPLSNNEIVTQSKAALNLIDAITNQIENLIAGGFKPGNIDADTLSPQLPNYSVNTPWNSSATIQTGISPNTYVIVLPNTPASICLKLSDDLKSRKNISNVSVCNANGNTAFSFIYKASNAPLPQ